MTRLWANYRLIARQLCGLLGVAGRRALALSLLLVGAVGVLQAMIPVAIGDLVDGLQAGTITGVRDAAPSLLAIAVAGFGIEALTLPRKWLVESVCARVERDLSLDVLGRLLNMDLGRRRAQMAGEVNGRIRDGIDGAVRGVKLVGLEFLPVASTVVAAVCVAAWRGPRMIPIMFGTLAIIIFIMFRQLASQSAIRQRLLDARQAFGGRIVERLAGVEAIQAYNRIPLELENAEERADALCEQELKHHTFMMAFDAVKGITERAGELALVATAVGAFASGACSAGDVLVQLALLRSVMDPLRQLHRILDEGQQATDRVRRLRELREIPQDAAASGLTGDTHDGQIAFRGLRAEREGVEILRGVDLVVIPGEIVALVGRSGAGKSTLLKVLLRHVEVSGGTASVGGVDISAMNRSSLASLFAYVQQKPWVFAGSVSANVSYGGDGDVESATMAAGLYTDVRKMPAGFAQMLGEHGDELSGGQRKRLTIARALASRSPILLFDEATSELDGDNIAHIMDALAQTGRTVLFVTHQPEVMRRAHRVVVLEDGVVRADGSYEALARANLIPVDGSPFAGGLAVRPAAKDDLVLLE